MPLLLEFRVDAQNFPARERFLIERPGSRRQPAKDDSQRVVVEGLDEEHFSARPQYPQQLSRGHTQIQMMKDGAAHDYIEVLIGPWQPMSVSHDECGSRKLFCLRSLDRLFAEIYAAHCMGSASEQLLSEVPFCTSVVEDCFSDYRGLNRFPVNAFGMLGVGTRENVPESPVQARALFEDGLMIGGLAAHSLRILIHEVPSVRQLGGT